MNESKKVSWNASEGLIMELSNRRSMANTHFISGNIKKAFNTLVSIKQSVIQSFKIDERNQLKAIENKFSKISSALVSSLSSSFNDSSRKLYIDAYTLAIKFYSEYNDRLMDLLEQYGYLIGEQSDSSKMKF
jgi:hypothetical protein